MLKKTLIFLILFFVAAASVMGLERRRDQFTTDFGYLVTPIPYILPGAGAGFGLLGGFNNIPFGLTRCHKPEIQTTSHVQFENTLPYVVCLSNNHVCV